MGRSQGNKSSIGESPSPQCCCKSRACGMGWLQGLRNLQTSTRENPSGSLAARGEKTAQKGGERPGACRHHHLAVPEAGSLGTAQHLQVRQGWSYFISTCKWLLLGSCEQPPPPAPAPGGASGCSWLIYSGQCSHMALIFLEKATPASQQVVPVVLSLLSHTHWR